MDHCIREPHPGDEQDLITLWHRVFGDPVELIGSFFRSVYSPEAALAAYADGIPAAAEHLISAHLALPDGTERPCRVLYALATNPGYRNRGLGSAIVREAVQKWDKRGAMTVLRPAEPDLFAFYNRLGFTNLFWFQTKTCSREQLGTLPAEEDARPIHSEEYLELRERNLRAVPHLRFDGAYLGFHETLCKLSGGGLFALSGGGCASAELDGGTVLLKELLTPGNPASALKALQTLYPAGKTFSARLPSSREIPGEPFCVAAGTGLPAAPFAWYGPALD